MRISAMQPVFRAIRCHVSKQHLWKGYENVLGKHVLFRCRRHFGAKSESAEQSDQWKRLMFNADGSLKDYYSVLGVDAKANVSEIQNSFTNLVKVTHPDSKVYNVSMNKNEALDRLREAQDAWNVLRSRKRRAFYDSERKRMSVLHNQSHIGEELVHGSSDWMGKTDKDQRVLREQMRHLHRQYDFKKWRAENRDPHTFIQMAHGKKMFNRTLAMEQDILSRESADAKVRRQRTLNYKLWRERMDQKKNAFGKQKASLDDDESLNERIEQLSDINRGNQEFYRKIYRDGISNLSADKDPGNVRYDEYTSTMQQPQFGPTPSAYYREINPQTPFGGDSKLSNKGREAKHSLRTPRVEISRIHSYKSDPGHFDENISRTLGTDEKVKIERNTNLSAGIGETHSDIKGDYSSNPSAYKYQRDEMKRALYEQYKAKERENKYRWRKEPMQIEGKVDEKAAGYSWFESIGANYKDPQPDAYTLHDSASVGASHGKLRGVGNAKLKSADAFNFNVNGEHSSPYHFGSRNSVNVDSSATMANSMILGHVGAICAVLFVFISWSGAKIQ